jgi:ribosomal protein S18 acetylase RimI-like enzyme
VSVRVRAAEPRDAPALVALARAVGGEPQGWLLTDDRWQSVGDERRSIRAAAGSAAGAVLVAEEDGAGVVGRLSTARDPNPPSRHVADVGLIVAATHRRRGIGRALLGAAEAWARSAGVTKIELHVFPHNDAAIALYEQAGFEREGYRRAQYRRPDGRLVDAILMAKLL